MFEVSPEWLAEVNITEKLPPELYKQMKNDIELNIMNRFLIAISEDLTEDQTSQFEELSKKDPIEAAKWIDQNIPNFSQTLQTIVDQYQQQLKALIY